MIRINLLEVREERRQIAFRNLAVIAATVWLCTAVFIYVWHSALTDLLVSVQAQIAEVEKEISALDTIVKEIEKIKANKKSLEGKLDIIRKLEENRAEIVDLLLAISEVMSEEVWVDKLSVTGRKISASAYAIDMQSIGQLIRKLKSDPRFENPTTAKIQAGSGKGGGGTKGTFVSFELSVAFVPPQATDAAKQAATGK